MQRRHPRSSPAAQEGSGAFVARLPDITLPGSIIGSSAFVVILQRRLGLYLTALAPILNAAAADGQVITEYERLGDADINASNNTARHNAALHAAYHALKSVIPPGATPPSYALCDRGDGSPASKEDAKRRWKWVNATHIPDIARVSAPPFGYELKAYTPFNQKVALGHGSNTKGGATVDEPCMCDSVRALPDHSQLAAIACTLSRYERDIEIGAPAIGNSPLSRED